MPSRRRRGGPALFLLALLGVAVPLAGLAPPARAAARRGTGASARPVRRPAAPPKPGWLVDRVRFEPLGFDRLGAPTASVLSAAGVGDYRGALEVVPAPAPAGGVAVVNDVGLEDYVRGIAEVPATWPAEALKAQAIAARTYALHELGGTAATAARAVGAQLCATDACQVYAGVAKERADATGAWTTAVAQTAGQVLLFKGGPINAKYSSSNGGRSVAGGAPYLRSVPDPDDVYSPLHQWHITVGLADVATALALPGTIQNVTRQGDTVLVDWAGPDGTPGQLQIAANDFRARLNTLPPPPGLSVTVPSNDFAPSVTDDDPAQPATATTLVLDGRGYGHGIGMSQWGAFGKALRGMRAADILAAYYDGLRPTPLAASQLPATVRVAVDLGHPGAQVGSLDPAVRFRVLDGAGHPLAVAAAGMWRVVPEGKGVRVLPPPGQDQPPAVQPIAVDPAAPTTQTPVRVRFRLSTPALVRVTLVDALGRPAVRADAQLRFPGDVAQSVPAPAQPGRYVVTIEADEGGGRTAAAPVAVDIGSPPGAAGTAGWAAPVELGRTGSAASARLVLASLNRLRRADEARSLGAGAAACLLVVLGGATAVVALKRHTG